MIEIINYYRDFFSLHVKIKTNQITIILKKTANQKKLKTKTTTKNNKQTKQKIKKKQNLETCLSIANFTRKYNVHGSCKTSVEIIR